MGGIKNAQFSSVTQLHPTICDLMDCSTSDFPVYHQLLELAQTHVHWVGHAIQASYPLLSPSPLLPSIFPSIRSFPMSQFFASGGHSIGASVQYQSFQWIIQDLLRFELNGLISLQSKGLSRVFSNTTVQKHQFFSTQLSSQSSSHIHTWLLEKP